MNIEITFKNLTREQAQALLAIPTYPVEELPIDEHIEIPAPSFEVDEAPEIKTRKPRVKKNTTEKVDELQPNIFAPPPPPPVPQETYNDFEKRVDELSERASMSTPPSPLDNLPKHLVLEPVTFNDFLKKVTSGLIGGKYPMEMVDAALAVNGLKTLMDAQSRPDLWDDITRSIGA